MTDQTSLEAVRGGCGREHLSSRRRATRTNVHKHCARALAAAVRRIEARAVEDIGGVVGRERCEHVIREELLARFLVGGLRLCSGGDQLDGGNGIVESEDDCGNEWAGGRWASEAVKELGSANFAAQLIAVPTERLSSRAYHRRVPKRSASRCAARSLLNACKATATVESPRSFSGSTGTCDGVGEEPHEQWHRQRAERTGGCREKHNRPREKHTSGTESAESVVLSIESFAAVEEEDEDDDEDELWSTSAEAMARGHRVYGEQPVKRGHESRRRDKKTSAFVN